MCENESWNEALFANKITANDCTEGDMSRVEYHNRGDIHKSISAVCKSSPESHLNYHRGAEPKDVFGETCNCNETLENTAFCQSTGNVSTDNIKITSSKASEEQKLIGQILSGYKVLIIMRGAPGSGKSFLAESLVKKCHVLNEKYGLQDFIFSADDYFYDSSGRYKYNVSKLEDAHIFNQRRVCEKAAAGWSPIIVDNTHMKIWEMMPYIQTAVSHGYILHVLEPNTPWRQSAGKLAMKNRHRVTREKIQIMLDKYENATVNDLLKMLKDTKYNSPLPQMRSVPPLPTHAGDIGTIGSFNDFRDVEAFDLQEATFDTDNDKGPFTNPAFTVCPKTQRETVRLKSVKVNIDFNENDDKNENYMKKVSPTMWKPFEQERDQFWGKSLVQSTETFLGNVPVMKTESERTLLDLLKEGVTDNPIEIQEPELPDLRPSFEMHKIGCPNENKSFASLRQIYPNKMLRGLWDLFIKCNGDIDWAVDILLKEEELSMGDHNYYQTSESDEYLLTCSCDENPKASHESRQLVQMTSSSHIKPQRQRLRQHRNIQDRAGAIKEVKEAIENRFVLGEEHYSVHVNKIRNMHSVVSGNSSHLQRTYINMETQTDPVTVVEPEELINDDGSELLEISLGDILVKQLSSIFDSEIINGENLPDSLKTNVFMPKALAKELFMLWMESAYNQIEEKRQDSLREDENFARLLKNPKYEDVKDAPENLEEILDTELAQMIYKKDQEQLEQLRLKQQPVDIATHLTRMKLCELFPNIPRETLLDVLEAHGNRFGETVTVLQGDIELAEGNSEPRNILLERAIQENELLNNIMIEHQQFRDSPTLHSVNNYVDPSKQKLQTDEAKRLALHDFEETRNLAAHHSQLKAECYQKAKEAIQKGNSSVAVYYSQIANLHKKKVDMYNHRAANCIMEVHKYTQNNPDLLDLHYLHVLEAVGCLDLFLDRHITNLRNMTKSFKHVFIITGRGLHSAGGVSTIKHKVKSRLKERSLRWSEVNPGLLKVKIFSASRYSKNI